ncbi:MAG: hypothetical protein U0414_39335 [Polyangiaceae bacterium]
MGVTQLTLDQSWYEPDAAARSAGAKDLVARAGASSDQETP